MRRTLAGAAVLLLAFTGHARAQDDSTMARNRGGAWATTTCGSPPVVWYSPDIPGDKRSAVVAHELAHVRHINQFGSCTLYTAWRRDTPDGMEITEGRAFCAGAKYDVLSGRQTSFMAAVWEQARVFAAYRLEWEIADAASVIYRHCSGWVPS